MLSWSFYSPVTSGSGRQPSHAPEPVSAEADRDLSLPVNSTGGHFVLGKHIPPGPGRWADFRRLLHVMQKHKSKPLKFLQKTGGRSKHCTELELIVGLKGMPDGAAPRDMLNICFVSFMSCFKKQLLFLLEAKRWGEETVLWGLFFLKIVVLFCLWFANGITR